MDWPDIHNGLYDGHTTTKLVVSGEVVNILIKDGTLVSGIVDVCGATFSMEDLPGTPEPSEDDADEMGDANLDFLKVEMGEDLAEALRKLCSQQQQFTLPPSPVSNESEGMFAFGTVSGGCQGGKKFKLYSAYRVI